jgi:hypothetical protein
MKKPTKTRRFRFHLFLFALFSLAPAKHSFCKGWTYEDSPCEASLSSQMDFNLLVRCALELRDQEETPFSTATLFNFQNRLVEHFVRSDENLLEHIFDNLTGGSSRHCSLRQIFSEPTRFLLPRISATTLGCSF